MDRQDRQGVRTPADLERKYRFTEAFRKIWDAITGVKKSEEDHVKDRNNPHGVTAEQTGARPDTWTPTVAEIGAAPAGFGLNNDFKTVNNTAALDSCFTCGWVRFIGTSNDQLMDCRQAIVRVDSFTNSVGGEILFQTAYIFNSVVQNVIRRICYNRVWQPWEWYDPPMEVGKEYRTTERYNGKPVYSMAIDCGAMPNSTAKAVAYAPPSGRVGGVVYCVGHTSQGDLLPYVTASSQYYISGSMEYITLVTNRDKTATTAIATVKYWKATD